MPVMVTQRQGHRLETRVGNGRLLRAAMITIKEAVLHVLHNSKGSRQPTGDRHIGFCHQAVDIACEEHTRNFVAEHGIS